MAGHDDAPAAAALGIEAGARVAVVNELAGWLDRLTLPPGARLLPRASEPLDVVVYFSDEEANVRRRLPVFSSYLAPGGTLWAAVPSDSPELTPEVVEAIGKDAGLVAAGRADLEPGWTATCFERR